MANIVLGLFSPFKFGLAEYEGYDIRKFKDNIRFLEVLISRDGELGGVCPLLFDGAVSAFKELPRPNEVNELNSIYEYLNKLRNPRKEISKIFFSFNIKSKVKQLFKTKQK